MPLGMFITINIVSASLKACLACIAIIVVQEGHACNMNYVSYIASYQCC